MAVSEEVLRRVCERLNRLDLAPEAASRGWVEARRMFGGYGLYRGELFFGLLSSDTLYLRVDDAGRRECTAAKVPNFDPRGDGRGMRTYFEVGDRVFDDNAELRRWVKRALGAAGQNRPAAKRGLAALRNIGPVSRRWLRAVGVHSRDDLERRGAADVWLAVREHEGTASLNLLYALEAARTDRLHTQLSPDEKASLRARVGHQERR